MNARFIAVLLAGAVSAVSLLEGCGGGGGGGGGAPSVIGPNLNGAWEGDFYITDGTVDYTITAQISHEGSNITLRTSRSAGTGVLLTGWINTEGHMQLTDGFDGETWTTIEGPATTNHVLIEDFTETPPPGHGWETDRYAIELVR
jgi:hypothetical protein